MKLFSGKVREKTLEITFVSTDGHKRYYEKKEKVVFVSVPLFIRSTWMSCLSDHVFRRVVFVFVCHVLQHVWFCCVVVCFDSTLDSKFFLLCFSFAVSRAPVCFIQLITLSRLNIFHVA